MVSAVAGGLLGMSQEEFEITFKQVTAVVVPLHKPEPDDDEPITREEQTDEK